MELKFDDGIPMPIKQSGSPMVLALKNIAVGQSFIVPIRPNGRPYTSANFNGYGKKLGMKFSVRKTEQGERCWRIA